MPCMLLAVCMLSMICHKGGSHCVSLVMFWLHENPLLHGPGGHLHLAWQMQKLDDFNFNRSRKYAGAHGAHLFVLMNTVSRSKEHSPLIGPLELVERYTKSPP